MSVISSGFSTIGRYATKVGKAYPSLVFGTGVEDMSKILKTSYKKQGFDGFWGQCKNAFNQGSDMYTKSVEKKGFWKTTWDSIKTTPETVSNSTKAGSRAAKMAGKNQILGGTKGFFKGLGKRMPLIGSALVLAFELPNIFKATKDEGIVSGAAETAKAGARLAGGALCAIVGGAIGGPIGSIAGYMIGEWITGKIVGKSYTELKEEREAQTQQAIAQATAQQYNPTFNGAYPTQQFNPTTQQFNPASGSTTYPTTQQYNPAFNGTSSSYNMGSSTITQEQLQQMQMALASGYGLNNNSFDMYC
ncbi:MAG: hypothetical protein R3Y28_05345 [Candidatus Gastranaerophilales bacterium]